MATYFLLDRATNLKVLASSAGLRLVYTPPHSAGTVRTRERGASEGQVGVRKRCFISECLQCSSALVLSPAAYCTL